MGLKECLIIFDNPNATYYSGQTVSGRVEITLDASKKIRGISICFKGECNTSWSKSETTTSTTDRKAETEWVTYSGTEEYFKIKYYLVGGQGSDELHLPSGKHVYPFTCLLPPTLPSSFEGEHGHIRYTVKVTLDRPWKFDQETKAAFTVITHLDLNQNPRIKEPFRVTLEKFFCCCWCKSGPLTCVICLPCTGFVPGQSIPVTAEVDNASNVEVENVYFALQKIVTYHSQTPRRDTKKVDVLVTELQVGPVAPHGSNTWNQNIQIPPLPPSNLTNCSLIDLDYQLQVEVRVSGLHMNPDTTIPLVIGTIPLVSMVPPSAPRQESVGVNMNSQAQIPNSHVGWVNDLYPNVPPPSYSQSVYGASNIQDVHDNEHVRFNNNSSQYSPFYPVYNFQNPSQ